MFCLACLISDAAELGFLVETERRTIEGVEYRYIVNNNQGTEVPCRNLEDVYVAIEEFNDERKRAMRSEAVPQFAG